MKMQKVEIEVPEFDGYEFVGYRCLDEIPAPGTVYVLQDYTSNPGNRDPELADAKFSMLFLSTKYFLYKKKPPRKIIFEEIEVGYVKPGNLYIDEYGLPRIWDGKCCSFMNAPKLRKVHDDFEVKNENAKS